MARAYIERIVAHTKPGNPFFLDACEVHHELCHPCTCINEFLAWIDSRPSTPFEKHLRRLVHGDTA